jgi:hypothetical protein
MAEDDDGDNVCQRGRPNDRWRPRRLPVSRADFTIARTLSDYAAKQCIDNCGPSGRRGLCRQRTAFVMAPVPKAGSPSGTAPDCHCGVSSGNRRHRYLLLVDTRNEADDPTKQPKQLPPATQDPSRPNCKKSDPKFCVPRSLRSSNNVQLAKHRPHVWPLMPWQSLSLGPHG